MNRESIAFERIDTIFFDVGNTLLSMDFDWISQELAERGVVAAPQTLRRAEAAARPAVSEGIANRAFKGGDLPGSQRAVYGRAQSGVVGRVHAEQHWQGELADVLERETLARTVAVVVDQGLANIGVTRQCPEPELLVEVGRCLIAEPLVDREGVLVDLVGEWVVERNRFAHLRTAGGSPVCPVGGSSKNSIEAPAGSVATEAMASPTVSGSIAPLMPA